MPLWTIHHPAGSYSDGDKQSIAQVITSLYPILPKFYVGVVFNETRDGSLYVGGVPVSNFVRISVDHIARQFDNDAIRQRWLAMCARSLSPYTLGRGFDWEIHIDETPFQLWLINGQRPPSPDSEHERFWIAENRPLPYPGRST
jgi:phenylpyruvate tautomerase PptA (4-oxalocrotonate tautomerase family)